MSSRRLFAGFLLFFPALAQQPADPIQTLVGRLSLESYKATIKGLTRFGDRRQGTERNRRALDWIEAQLRSYGCGDIERLRFDFTGQAGIAFAEDPTLGPGGARPRGVRGSDQTNNDPMKQPDRKLRELDTQRSAPGEREEIYCTKVGAVHPGEMYIVAAHFDGEGYGEAANDDASGAALVMELARVFSDPAVRTGSSIRFALWNNEETGFSGARAYVAQRRDMQGRQDPPGSGKYPEPLWLGMIQHDMMLYDHGAPKKDPGTGALTMSKDQRPEADVNIEYQIASKMATEAMSLAAAFQRANEKFATDYPANVGQHMTNTDSTPFMDLTPSLSIREAERGAQIGSGWDPQHHQPTDVFSFYGDDDFRLGLNAAQTTLGAVAELTGLTLAPGFR